MIMKKIVKNIKYMALMLLLTFGAFSCLNDEGYTDLANGVGSNNLILSWAGNFGTTANIIVQAGGTEADYPMSVTLSSSKAPTKDYTVTVVPETDSLAYVAKINAGLPASDRFWVLKDNMFDIESPTVNITKGQRDAPFVITFYPDQIDKSKSWMIPLRLTSSDPSVIVSGNQGVAKLAFIGNIYAGTYKVNYTLEREGNAPQNFTNESQVLEPIDSKLLFCKYPGFSFFGNPTIFFKMSVNANNTVNIFSATAGEGAGVSITPLAGQTNIYDPVTKTFTLNYEYYNATPAYRRFTNVIMVKQ
jgi:hypothetical protein